MAEKGEKVDKYPNEFTVPVFPEFDGERVLCRKYSIELGMCLIFPMPSPRNDEEVQKYTKAANMAEFVKKAVLGNAHGETLWDTIKKDKTSVEAVWQALGGSSPEDPKIVKAFESALTEKAVRKPGVAAETKAKAADYDAAVANAGGKENLEKLLAMVKEGKIKVK